MSRHICIHGHFYQPPRENPWLEEIERQDSAHPFHDWNARITAECYAPNARSRILDADRRIIDLVNNYSTISFNFGPTLLSWLDRNDPDTYAAILEADQLSRENFSGHGSAIAQCYNHMILPLANSRDKRTQILWGIRDFAFRFGRYPEGMWLAETAVDIETLDIMAQNELAFTILAPHQAHEIRRIGHKKWHDVSDGSIDPRRPYKCTLPSGLSISLFFYDGPISHDLAFSDLLDSGERLANRLTEAFTDIDETQLVHIATDGETYGHHHSHGDMALAYGMYCIRKQDLAKITNYGEYLERYPPEYEVRIFENTSWSCVHGVERWRSDCGCSSGGHDDWNQQWRGPLRDAHDWLRDILTQVYEDAASQLVSDPWAARDAYIERLLEHDKPLEETAIGSLLTTELDSRKRTRLLRLLEMQCHAMLMYTSCGWFFDDISGIETTQVIAYAARAMQLACEVGSPPLEKKYRSFLEDAPSNIVKFGNGAYVYDNFVKPSVIDLNRVGAHFAISSLFDKNIDSSIIYSFSTKSITLSSHQRDKYLLSTGTVVLRSRSTLEESTLDFAALYLGECNCVCKLGHAMDNSAFTTMESVVTEAFGRGDIVAATHRINEHFQGENYSLWHLFRDQQRHILKRILDSNLDGIESSIHKIKMDNYKDLNGVRRFDMPLPPLFSRIISVIQDVDLLRALEKDDIDIQTIDAIIKEVNNWGIPVDRICIRHAASKVIAKMTDSLLEEPEDTDIIESLVALLQSLESLSLDLDVWKVQNTLFSIGKKLLEPMQAKERRREDKAKRWLTAFYRLGRQLKVKLA